MYEKSNDNTDSYSNFCEFYECLSDHLESSDKWFLAGENRVKTTEIEVYQITHFY